MKNLILKRASAAAVLLGAVAVAPVASTSTANAATTAACTMSVGSITAGGDIANTGVTASSPIKSTRGAGPHLFAPGLSKLASTWTTTVGVAGEDTTYGQVIVSGTLYSGEYGHDSTGKPTSSLQSLGVGYLGYKAIESSFYWGKTVRGADYRLRGDGVLYRFGAKRQVTRYPGYSAVKTMALISETATYDTFLAVTNGGALYTIHIPTSTAAPVVKKVRTSTWQNFDVLVAEKCGTQSTLLTAIDKDTGSAYLYAVGHANGAATVIQGLGKIPGTFSDPVYYLHTAEGNAPLFGE
ncbi:hypothetical protein OHA18_21750 [Kribbella sp. NBC_00709]|uniref:hypothetical protein n=1 Tax=Kribbella sp. NBC_00709 TaxID=2975972 RepID=UPI002E283205|nr:hypothetical protein [Kribbella sp. NBC_00709]